MKRIYHPYWEWEDWKAGMWRSIGGLERKIMLAKAITFTGNASLYGSYMDKVITVWPVACEHNLTERSMNRLAWVGHAAACLAIQCPEDVTREAWGHLSDQQRIDADRMAELAVKKWESIYEREDSQLHLCLEA